jgi:hypothetical protein
MNDFSYVSDANIKRFRNLLETSVDETERRAIQRLLTEEVAKASSALPLKADPPLRIITANETVCRQTA